MGVSIREAECWLNAKLFFNKYPWWNIKGPHCPNILHSMFLHAAREGQKEVERFICQGCWQSPPRTDPKENLSPIWLVGYQISQKEIQDLNHASISAKEVTQPTATWPLAERGNYSGHLVIADELVAKAGGAALQEEDQYGVAATTYQPFNQSEGLSWSHERRSQHDEALQEAREAHKQALEATHQLELDIKRLSKGVGNIKCQCPCSHSGSCWQSKTLDRWDRSLSQCRLEWHVTFCEPEVEPFSGGGPYQEPGGTSPKHE